MIAAARLVSVAIIFALITFPFLPVQFVAMRTQSGCFTNPCRICGTRS